MFAVGPVHRAVVAAGWCGVTAPKGRCSVPRATAHVLLITAFTAVLPWKECSLLPAKGPGTVLRIKHYIN